MQFLCFLTNIQSARNQWDFDFTSEIFVFEEFSQIKSMISNPIAASLHLVSDSICLCFNYIFGFFSKSVIFPHAIKSGRRAVISAQSSLQKSPHCDWIATTSSIFHTSSNFGKYGKKSPGIHRFQQTSTQLGAKQPRQDHEGLN